MRGGDRDGAGGLRGAEVKRCMRREARVSAGVQRASFLPRAGLLAARDAAPRAPPPAPAAEGPPPQHTLPDAVSYHCAIITPLKAGTERQSFVTHTSEQRYKHSNRGVGDRRYAALQGHVNFAQPTALVSEFVCIGALPQ